MGPCFFLPEHLFCPSHGKTCWNMSTNIVSLKICLLGNLKLHGHFDIVFLSVNRSGLGMSSSTHHRIYKALGHLHGPWCKQSLRKWEETKAIQVTNDADLNSKSIVNSAGIFN